MSKLLDVILHFFMPNRCFCCRKHIEYNQNVCKECEKTLPFVDLSKCPICQNSVCKCTDNYFDYLITPFYYEIGIDNAIRDMKFKDNLLNAKKLGFYMTNCMKSTGLDKNVDMIIPIPLYQKDMKRRGYNQSYELSKWVSKGIDKPINTSVLYKIKQTKKQHDLSSEERKTNLIGAYRVINEEMIKGKCLLLVDDVFTTGTTINSCAKILKKAGCKKIIALTVSKTRV